MTFSKLISAFAAVLCSTGSLSAQGDSCTKRILPVNVVTQKGEIVTGLSAENLQAFLHHKPARILSVTTVRDEPRVALLIDRSASMGASKGLWQTNVSAAKTLVRALPARSLVSITTFSVKTETLAAFTNDRAKLQDTLEKLQADQPRGRTSMWDAMAEVISSQFEKPQPGDSLYLISDSRDSSSKKTVEDLHKILAKSRVRLFAFSITEKPPPEVFFLNWNETDLPGLVQSTGGAELQLARPFNATDGAFPALVDKAGNPTEAGRKMLRQFPLIFDYNNVEIELPEPISKQQHLELSVKGLNERDLVTVYPHTLAACEAELATTPMKR